MLEKYSICESPETIEDMKLNCSSDTDRMKLSVAILKPVKVMMNKRNAKEVTMIIKSGYAALYVINGTMKTAL